MNVDRTVLPHRGSIVLSHLNKAQLKPHVAEIQAFAKGVETMRPRIKDRVDKLLSRLPT
jgi:ribosomal protein L34E